MTINHSIATPDRISAPAAALPVSKPRRLIELDILRGFLLLGMTLTHLPTKASVFFNQTFGFVSHAEGFIFLAAFMMGQIEQRAQQKGGESFVLRDVLRRVCRIYFYQWVLLAVAFTVLAGVGVRFHRLALENLLSFYLQDPRHAVIAAALLEYQPSLMDILPMYIVFMLLTPLARGIARRFGWETVLFLSFIVWAAAQFGLRAWVYSHSDFFSLHVPENSTGALDVYGWQLLWMTGLAVGSICAESLSEAAPRAGDRHYRMPGWLVTLSCIVAGTFLVLRYAPADHWTNAQLYGWLVDKWHLGAARLIDFAVITLLMVRFGQRLAGLPFLKPLASLGQASIQVFSIHVFFCTAAQALSKEADPQLAWWQQCLLLGITISALFVTAHLAKKYSHNNGRNRVRLLYEKLRVGPSDGRTSLMGQHQF